jgi:hypothetical protein
MTQLLQQNDPRHLPPPHHVPRIPPPTEPSWRIAPGQYLSLPVAIYFTSIFDNVPLTAHFFFKSVWLDLLTYRPRLSLLVFTECLQCVLDLIYTTLNMKAGRVSKISTSNNNDTGCHHYQHWTQKISDRENVGNYKRSTNFKVTHFWTS